MSRGRRYEFPKPEDVKVGNPSFLATQDLIVTLYNQENSTDTVKSYCKKAREWFSKEALYFGWTRVNEIGNGGILLSLEIKVHRPGGILESN